jgi:hypothetical protein
MILHVDSFPIIKRALIHYVGRLDKMINSDELLVKNEIILNDLKKEKGDSDFIISNMKTKSYQPSLVNENSKIVSDALTCYIHDLEEFQKILKDKLGVTPQLKNATEEIAGAHDAKLNLSDSEDPFIEF